MGRPSPGLDRSGCVPQATIHRRRARVVDSFEALRSSFLGMGNLDREHEFSVKNGNQYPYIHLSCKWFMMTKQNKSFAGASICEAFTSSP
jgi:hypothetical protein